MVLEPSREQFQVLKMTMAFTQDLEDGLTDEFADLSTTLIGVSGKIRIFDDSGGIPANTSASDTGNLLVEIPLSSTPINYSGGNDWAASIFSTGSASASGTMLYFRITDSSNVCIMQGNIDDSGSPDILFNTTTVNTSDTVTVSSFGGEMFLTG